MHETTNTSKTYYPVESIVHVWPSLSLHKSHHSSVEEKSGWYLSGHIM